MKKRMKPNARLAPFSRPTLAVGCVGQLDTSVISKFKHTFFS